MKASVYAVEAEVEETHWWFTGRKILFQKIIQATGIPTHASVLDVGTGTGSNLRLLQKMGFTHVTGVDQSEDAIRFCEEKGLGKVEKGNVCNLPFAADHFQLILATDLIEHVDDTAALKELFRVLSPNGTVVFTVPAFQMLWGLQDELSDHKRRYTKTQFERVVANAGFKISKSFYFNYLLFIPIWAARQVVRLLDIKLESENQINTPWINRVLTAMFHFDVLTAPHLKPPFGVSILIVARIQPPGGST
ncbi:MAG: methyltransferase [Nitrospinaceae bacterium]|nr:MAG: methyltransferase [Nitrospinaceae bacterium]